MNEGRVYLRMKKYGKMLASFGALGCLSLGSATIIFAQNSIVDTSSQGMSVCIDPINAVIATAFIGIIGIVACIKRRGEN